MNSTFRRLQGFTLIELVVTLTVVLILLALAAPSFFALRQRASLNAAGEQVVGLWNQARLEAAKRNSLVKVGVMSSGADYCLGVATTTDLNDNTPCDCLDPAAITNVCDVAKFPADQGQWSRVTLFGTPTLGDDGVVVIEPKRTSIVDSTDAGAISLNGPPGRNAYRLNFLVDRFGRAALCESTAATHRMPAYAEQRCGP